MDYSDIFISPWCCDSSHEDRYEALVHQMRELELDPTTVVLLSVMSLFYISQSQASSSLAASSTIASHQRKFSLLLQRYLAKSLTVAHTNYVVMSGISFKARDVTELLSCMRSILRAWRNCMRWQRF